MYSKKTSYFWFAGKKNESKSKCSRFFCRQNQNELVKLPAKSKWARKNHPSTTPTRPVYYMNQYSEWKSPIHSTNEAGVLYEPVKRMPSPHGGCFQILLALPIISRTMRRPSEARLVPASEASVCGTKNEGFIRAKRGVCLRAKRGCVEPKSRGFSQLFLF